MQHIRIIVHSKNEAAALADIEVQSLGENIALAQEAIETIDREATSEGLTKKIEKLLEK